MAQFNIREGKTADLDSVISLIQEFADFQKSSAHMKNSLWRMKDEEDYFKFLIAETSNGKIVGYLAYFHCYYTWIGKSMHIDDLYVRPENQGRGVGKKLFLKVKEIASSKGCHKLSWQVSKWNDKAIAFYRSLGADITEEEMNCSIVL